MFTVQSEDCYHANTNHANYVNLYDYIYVSSMHTEYIHYIYNPDFQGEALIFSESEAFAYDGSNFY